MRAARCEFTDLAEQPVIAARRGEPEDRSDRVQRKIKRKNRVIEYAEKNGNSWFPHETVSLARKNGPVLDVANAGGLVAIGKHKLYREPNPTGRIPLG